MTTSTVLLILFSLIIAGSLSYFQYLYKAKNKSNLNLFLAFLRFLSFFGILLLLVNPIITRNTLEVVKPPLAIVVDNSSSIFYLKADKSSLDLHQSIVANKNIQEKFSVQSYQFDNDFSVSEKFNYKGTQTNFDGISKNLKNVNRNQTFPTVIITDGNQTTGNDYVYTFDNSNKVYPIVIGDTTKILDLKINQLNVNKYAFHKNKFPVEVFLQYSGDKKIQAELAISQGSSVIAKQKISFSSTSNSATINLLLPADKVGVQVFKATITAIEKEKNTYNNTKYFAVDITDQKTKVAIISNISHPDVGALKRAIEINEQRKVTIVKPNDVKSLEDFAVCILYQPNSGFKSVLEQIKRAGSNAFVITGMHTDFTFLNQNQNYFEFKMSNQAEDFTASYNSQFNLFSIDNIGFENFPPLENPFGKITTKGPISILLSSKIRNMETNSPLLAFAEKEGKRMAFLFGENSWRWRLQSNINQQSFDQFDVFIDKTIQFLASNSAKKALIVNHENFYNSGESIEVSAQFFNKNYEFDERAHLTISVSNKQTKQSKNYDLLKSNNSYKVNLEGLEAGNYNFTVKELNTNNSYTSNFEILDFDIEKQFVNTDAAKLRQLASQTGGKAFYPNEIDSLIQQLLNEPDYQAIQKNTNIRSPLIEWYWLLVLIAFFLSCEWFVRKYNGLL